MGATPTKKKVPVRSSINVVLSGGPGVGKRSLAGTYPPEYCRRPLQVDGQRIFPDVNLCNTQFSSMNEVIIKHAEIILFVFSMTSQNSFKEVTYFYEQAQPHRQKKAKMAILANKADLETQFEVSPPEIKALSDTLGIPFYTVYAPVEATDFNTLYFENILREIVTDYINQNI